MIVAKASIRLRQTAEGGRGTPIVRGYRSTLRFADTCKDCAIYFEEKQALMPGEECVVTLRFPSNFGREVVLLGATFDITEGPHIVGNGIIQNIHKDD